MEKEMLYFFFDRCQYKLVENFYRLQNPAHAVPNGLCPICMQMRDF